MIKRVYKKIQRTLFQGSNPRNVLLKRMPKNSICAEIGSWKGDFSQRILSVTKPEKLFLIDPYKYVSEYSNAWYGGFAGGQEKMDEIYSMVISRFKDEINRNRLEIIRCDSREALNNFKDESLDWVYVDGNHTYEFVMEDLRNCWSKVKTGGYITGDDYHVPGWWEDGVTRAVDNFIEERKNSIGEIVILKNQFIIEKI